MDWAFTYDQNSLRWIKEERASLANKHAWEKALKNCFGSYNWSRRAEILYKMYVMILGKIKLERFKPDMEGPT